MQIVFAEKKVTEKFDGTLRIAPISAKSPSKMCNGKSNNIGFGHLQGLLSLHKLKLEWNCVCLQNRSKVTKVLQFSHPRTCKVYVVKFIILCEIILT